jgi:hypothetical protein
MLCEKDCVEVIIERIGSKNRAGFISVICVSIEEALNIPSEVLQKAIIINGVLYS